MSTSIMRDEDLSFWTWVCWSLAMFVLGLWIGAMLMYYFSPWH